MFRKTVMPLISGAKGCGFESLLAYKAKFNSFNTKASNFGGLCCLHEWTNVDKKGQKSHPKSHPDFGSGYVSHSNLDC